MRTEYPEAKVARNLTLISKVLMNLGNVLLFGAKEPYLEPLNPWITENIPKMKTFIDSIAVRIDQTFLHARGLPPSDVYLLSL
jgi:neurofibromin 1